MGRATGSTVAEALSQTIPREFQHQLARKIPAPHKSTGGENAWTQVLRPVPVLFGLPAVFSSVPPLMVFVPATLAFGIQIPASALGLRAVIAMVMDGSVEVGLRFFNGMLTVRPVIGVSSRCCYEEQKCQYD